MRQLFSLLIIIYQIDSKGSVEKPVTLFYIEHKTSIHLRNLKSNRAYILIEERNAANILFLPINNDIINQCSLFSYNSLA
jgi:hypothetical protein